MSRRATALRSPLRAAALVGCAAILVLLSGSAAGAAKHGGARHRTATHRGRLPSVRYAKALTKEPVVHAQKGSPPKGLRTKDLVVGTGSVVKAGSTVSLLYVGANYKNGKDFTQATWTKGTPATFSLAQVVPGFARGLVGMKVGGRREIVIPPALGYGNHKVGPIKADETLVFVVDLKGVSP